jgi:hypothetical protein
MPTCFQMGFSRVKTTAGLLVPEVRMQVHSMAMTKNLQLYIWHEAGFCLTVQYPPGYMNTPLSFLPMKRKGV